MILASPTGLAEATSKDKMKRYGITVLALVTMLLAGSIVESRGNKAKAIYATLVSITNASPGIVYDANAPSRIPY